MNGRILLVDDDPHMCALLEADLQLRGHEAIWRLSGEGALEALSESEFDVVLTDMNMPRMSGLELCAQIKDRWPDIPVIVITAFGSMDAAVEALRRGAYDFVTKPVELDVLAAAFERAIQQRRLSREIKSLHDALNKLQGHILGESPVMRQLNRLIGQIAPTDASILICGESGTGKELVAREVHRLSQRAKHPFIAINCAALPENLIESELFGHKPGAFTDARHHKGLFVQAHGGTLFLDELGDLPLKLQPKLLRALEERRVRPLGGDSEIEVDVRIVSATNQNLEELVESGAFREDLYYRLNVVSIGLPPLRARGNDILLLAQHFTEHFAQHTRKSVHGLSEGAARRLLEYPWPGNVRELKNTIERAVALTSLERLAPLNLPERVLNHKARAPIPPWSSEALAPLAEVERAYILHVYESTGGNRTETARVLGIDRKTLYRKLRQYGKEA